MLKMFSNSTSDVTVSQNTNLDKKGQRHSVLHDGIVIQGDWQSDGIVELPDDAPVGKIYADWAELSDPIFEIGLTPNRGDCLSLNGLSRDLNVFFGKAKPYKTFQGDIGELNLNFNNLIYGVSGYISLPRVLTLYAKADLSPLFKNQSYLQNNISLGIRLDID